MEISSTATNAGSCSMTENEEYPMLDKGETIRKTKIIPEDFTKTVREMMSLLEGERVAVTATSIPDDRNGFHTQIGVTGKLELHGSKQKTKCRVVVNPDTFTYFQGKDVQTIVILPEETATRRNITAVIYIEVSQKQYKTYKKAAVWNN